MTTASTWPADPLVHRYVTENSHAQWPYTRRPDRADQRRTPGSLPRPAAGGAAAGHHQTIPAATAQPDEALERRAGRDARGPGRVRRVVRGPARKPTRQRHGGG